MKCLVLCVGSLKETFWQEAQKEYLKRLSRFGTVEVREVKDFPEPRNASPAQKMEILQKEGEALKTHFRRDDLIIALCIEGRSMDSMAFSRHLRESVDTGRRIVFVIGGSLGLHETVKAQASLRLSFSPMTFPHQLSRVLLLEQLYRACKITAGENYHK